MFIDCTKLPDPTKPQRDDLYVSLDRQHTLVVLDVPKHAREDETGVISFVLNGLPNACPRRHLLGILTSIGARPWGRLDRSDAGRPALTRDPELVAQRLQAIGPHLRALREQYGLSMGDLARALGCPPARLSKLELADPDPVSGGAGVREDEGRAALAELLTDTVSRALGYALGEEDGLSGLDRERVWEALHGMLATAPALAAMATIHAAQAKSEIAARPDAAGVFKVDDRVTYKGIEARIAELDVELQAAMLQRPSGEHLVAPFTDIALANETVDVQTARAGLALHLARVVAQSMDPRSEAEIERSEEQRQLQATIASALASDEAQRLIRLHG